MRKAVSCTLAATSVLLAACATGPRRPAEATAAETLASCERTIYQTAAYDEPTALRCAHLLDIWH